MKKLILTCSILLAGFSASADCKTTRDGKVWCEYIQMAPMYNNNTIKMPTPRNQGEMLIHDHDMQEDFCKVIVSPQSKMTARQSQNFYDRFHCEELFNTSYEDAVEMQKVAE